MVGVFVIVVGVVSTLQVLLPPKKYVFPVGCKARFFFCIWIGFLWWGTLLVWFLALVRMNCFASFSCLSAILSRTWNGVGVWMVGVGFLFSVGLLVEGADSTLSWPICMFKVAP